MTFSNQYVPTEKYPIANNKDFIIESLVFCKSSIRNNNIMLTKDKAGILYGENDNVYKPPVKKHNKYFIF